MQWTENAMASHIDSAGGGHRPREAAQLGDFQTLVGHLAQEIVQKWINYFILHRPIAPEVIARRIK